MSDPSRVVVYGGGVAALRASLELALRGIGVALVSPVDPASWPSLPDGGISAGDDPEAFIADALACGDYLAARAPVRAMCRAAADHVAELVRMGVPFSRDAGGELALRRLPGSSRAAAGYVEGRTEQAIEGALLSALLRQGERVRVLEPLELVSLVVADGRCSGIVARHRVSGEVLAIGAEAVLLACGGPERLFGARGDFCLEGPLALAARAGAVMANIDLCQLHPATLPTPRGLVIPSGALRGEGARLWVPAADSEARIPGDIPRKERLRFLEDSHPGWAELVPDDIAARATQRIVAERGIYSRKKRANEAFAYLDLTHLPEGHLRARLGAELGACEALAGVDPALGALRVTPGSMGLLGGLWVDHAPLDDGLDEASPHNHAASIPALYAAGPGACLYHGSCRLGGNGVLADLHGGRLAARAIAALLERGAEEPAEAALAEARERVSEPPELAEERELTRALRELAALALGPAAAAGTAEAAIGELPDVEVSASAPSYMHTVLRLALASARARAAGGTGARAAMLARLEGDEVVMLEGFEAGGRRVRAAIDEDGVAPAPRGYAEAP